MVKVKGDTTTTTTSSTAITIDSTYPALHALSDSPCFPLPPAMFLPLHATLPGGKRVIVNRVSDHQVSEVFLMIQDSARSGDGYGVDEFPSEKDFQREVLSANGKIFQVCDQESGATLAAFVVLDSKYYRGQGTVADSYTVVKREERRKGLGEFCMQLIIEFAQRLGYAGLYSDTFHDNIAMRKIIEQAGFQKVGFLPMSARMPDGSVKPSVIYYRELPAALPGALASHQSHLGDRPTTTVLQGKDTCVESDTLPS